jgi:hypothetical protein
VKFQMLFTDLEDGMNGRKEKAAAADDYSI